MDRQKAKDKGGVYCLQIIDEIYDSIGTCIDCKHATLLNEHTIVCDSKEHYLNWFCANFERDEIINEIRKDKK